MFQELIFSPLLCYANNTYSYKKNIGGPQKLALAIGVVSLPELHHELHHVHHVRSIPLTTASDINCNMDTTIEMVIYAIKNNTVVKPYSAKFLKKHVIFVANQFS